MADAEKELILFRHAKSAWDDPELDDFDRGLADRGIRAAPRMASWLIEKDYQPDGVLSSSSVRTRATVALVAERLGLASRPLRYDDDLYVATAEELTRVIREIGQDESLAPCQRVMIVGHNPGLHAFALSCIAQASRDDVERLASKFPTAAIAVFRLHCTDWSDFKLASGRLLAFETPKRLR